MMACAFCYIAQMICVLVSAFAGWFTFTYVASPYNQYWGTAFGGVVIFLVVTWNCRYLIRASATQASSDPG